MTVYNEFFLNGARFRPLLDIAPETLHQLHLRMILHDRFSAPTLGFTQNIAMIVPPELVARVIDTAPGSHALMHEIMPHTLRGRPLSYQQMTSPPNGRRLNILTSADWA